MSFPSEWIVSSLGENDDDETPAAPGVSVSTETVEASKDEAPFVLPTHLFLHFDVNETILLGDDAGGDSRNESVQKMLAKSAFCRIPAPPEGSPPWETTRKMKPTHWWDGQEIGRETSMPPLYTGWTWPEGCCPYYRTAYKKHAKSFTEAGNHGRIYGPLLEACEASLSSSRNYSIPSRSSRDNDDGGSSSNANEHSNNQNKNTILPAFYETLHHLVNSCDRDGANQSGDPPFTLVFRTFGSDLSEIAKVVTTFAKGEHPDYPGIDFPQLCLPADRLYQGRWKVLDGEEDEEDGARRVIYQLWTSDESELVASGDSEILEFLSHQTVLGIRDDYNFWKASRYIPSCGKPIWVPKYHRGGKRNDDDDDAEGAADAEDGSAPYGHHLIFDDNIHNLPDDGIACVRRASGDTANGGAPVFESVDGDAMDEYQGVHLVRVPTVEPVLNPRWYIDQIRNARTRLQHRLQSK